MPESGIVELMSAVFLFFEKPSYYFVERLNQIIILPTVKEGFFIATSPLTLIVFSIFEICYSH